MRFCECQLYEKKHGFERKLHFSLIHAQDKPFVRMRATAFFGYTVYNFWLGGSEAMSGVKQRLCSTLFP